MAQFKTTNAVTHRLAGMRMKWMSSLHEDTKAVVWKVELDEVRMIEAFTALEASEHGVLPMYFLDFQVPFEGKDQYAKALREDWLERWADEDSMKKVESAGKLPDWDSSPFKWTQPDQELETFLECMASFSESIPDGSGRLILNLMPAWSHDQIALAEWMGECIEKLPKNLCLLLFDVKGQECFPELLKQTGVIPIKADLNMKGAMREIAASGDPNQPGIRFNVAILNLTDALQADDEAGVHKWGKEARKIGKEIGTESLEATGAIAYGTALYQMKMPRKALAEYKFAEALARKGHEKGDITCAAILLQVLSMTGAAHLLDKDDKKTVLAYEMLIKEAGKQRAHLMEVEGCRLLAELPIRSLRSEDQFQYLRQGFDAGRKIPSETQRYSSMLPVCLSLHRLAEKRGDDDTLNQVNSHAETIWGKDWKQIEVNSETEPILNSSPKRKENAPGLQTL
jgi:hypothetical protein